MGAPLGNTNGSKQNRLWGETIRRAVAQNDAVKLRGIADKLVEMALAGDVAAMREMGDRLDGKPAQQVQLSGDADGAPIRHRVEQVIVDPEKPDTDSSP